MPNALSTLPLGWKVFFFIIIILIVIIGLYYLVGYLSSSYFNYKQDKAIELTRKAVREQRAAVNSGDPNVNWNWRMDIVDTKVQAVQQAKGNKDVIKENLFLISEQFWAELTSPNYTTNTALEPARKAMEAAATYIDESF